MPDEYSGELPLAFVSLSPAARAAVEADPAEGDRIKSELIKVRLSFSTTCARIRNADRAHLPWPWQSVADAKVHYKRLAGGVEFIDAVPRNPSGKLLRRVLREHAKIIQASRSAAAAEIKVPAV